MWISTCAAARRLDRLVPRRVVLARVAQQVDAVAEHERRAGRPREGLVGEPPEPVAPRLTGLELGDQVLGHAGSLAVSRQAMCGITSLA
jgi:hypothetical protein